MDRYMVAHDSHNKVKIHHNKMKQIQITGTPSKLQTFTAKAVTIAAAVPRQSHLSLSLIKYPE